MSRKNAHVRTIRREAGRLFDNYVMLVAQFGMDAAAMAAQEVFHMGPARAAEFSAAYQRAFNEIMDAVQDDTPDLEHTFALLDRRLQPIYGANFCTSEERYGK